MPAKKDMTMWKKTKGDHADDTTYERRAPKVGKKSTDEVRTAQEAKAK